MHSIDKQDRLLLSALQQDASLSILELSEICHLSAASIQRRIKRLKQAGVIERSNFKLNAKLLDKGMTFIVMVEMEREQVDQLDQFKRVASDDPDVQQCYYITGEADFVLICLTKDMEEFEALTKRLFFSNNNVRRFTTNVVMSKPKVTLNVPIDLS